MDALTEAQWLQFQQDGFLRLGKVLADEDLASLQERIDQIMLGDADVPYPEMLMQLDSSSGVYEDAGVQSYGHKARTLNYRKIQDLELDPLFRAFTERPLFRDICTRQYGADTPIAAFRCMFMNKPANQGTFLPWHQDRWTDLDRDPIITIWTALDPATIENGCVQIIPRSHGKLINPEHVSGFLTEELAAENAPGDRREFVTLQAGETVLLHNWLLHASDVNRSSQSRRAYSVCYMDANTHSRSNAQFRRLF